MNRVSFHATIIVNWLKKVSEENGKTSINMARLYCLLLSSVDDTLCNSQVIVFNGRMIINNRLKVFENRVLRGIFGPKREKATGDWRKLHMTSSSIICNFHQILLG
jgi:hypothetical protein